MNREPRDLPDPAEELLDDDPVDGEDGEARDSFAPTSGPTSSAAKRIDADAILDTLMPPSIDWRGTVRRHPMASVATVALVGYLVGRTKGAAIVSGVTAGLSSALVRQLSDVFDGDFFEF